MRCPQETDRAVSEALQRAELMHFYRSQVASRGAQDKEQRRTICAQVRCAPKLQRRQAARWRAGHGTPPVLRASRLACAAAQGGGREPGRAEPLGALAAPEQPGGLQEPGADEQR